MAGGSWDESQVAQTQSGQPQDTSGTGGDSRATAGPSGGARGVRVRRQPRSGGRPDRGRPGANCRQAAQS